MKRPARSLNIASYLLNFSSMLLLLGLRFLANIQFQVVVQRPGTLIYVREWVLNQVLNIGLNLAEAVNVGGPGWNHLAHTFAPCGCTDTAVVSVPLNPNFYEIIKSHGTRPHTCPHPGYLHTSVSGSHSRLHAGTHDNGASSRAPHGCYLCSAVYATEGHLRNHLRNQHPDGTARDERVCPGCNRVYNSPSITKHKRGCAAWLPVQRLKVVSNSLLFLFLSFFFSLTFYIFVC